MKKTKTTFRNGLFARFLKRLLGEQRGAVAMEYIMITLLVAAAIFALVMVFGSQLKNMLNTIIEIMTGKNPQEVEKVVEEPKDTAQYVASYALRFQTDSGMEKYFNGALEKLPEDQRSILSGTVGLSGAELRAALEKIKG